MFRQYGGKVDNNGNGAVQIFHNNTAMEWDIYQISVTCGTMGAACVVQISINGAFLCATPQGSMDTATGPPDAVLNSADVMLVQWSNGIPGDQLEVNVWFNENVVGTTMSTAH